MVDTESIRFQCLHCPKQLRAPAKLAGQRVRCPKCKKLIDVPSPVNDEEPEVKKEMSESTAPRRLWPWFAGGACVVALIIGVGVWLAAGTKKQPEPLGVPEIKDIVGVWRSEPLKGAILELSIDDSGNCGYVWWYNIGLRGGVMAWTPIRKAGIQERQEKSADFLIQTTMRWEARERIIEGGQNAGWLSVPHEDFFFIKLDREKRQLEVFNMTGEESRFILSKQ